MRAYQQLAAGDREFRNTVEFRDYRKFTGESKIPFNQSRQSAPPKKLEFSARRVKLAG
jgi:hypothetical protein